MQVRLFTFILFTLALTSLLGVACNGEGGSAGPSPDLTAPAGTPNSTPQPLGTAAVGTFDLATEGVLLTIRTADSKDFQTGISNLAAGDFNDDGVSDLIIGLPFADGPDNSRPDAGEAHVIFGHPDLPAEIDLGKESGLEILGALPNDNLGFGVAGGDINGDGIDDVIVGAPGSNGLINIRTDAGEVYVVFGRSDLGGSVDTAEEEQDFTFMAAEGFARAGTSFAVADVNDDEVADLVVGAPFAGREPDTPPGGPRTTVGEVYAVFGSKDLGGSVTVAADEQDFTLVGTSELDAFGQSVAGGDVDGDGVDDIIVGARGFDRPDGEGDGAGAVFVFFGSSNLPSKLGIGDAAFTMLGAEADDSLGDVIAGGDVNGDGLTDFVAVARTADGSNNERRNSGEAYVVYGNGSLGGTLDLASETPQAVILGEHSSALTAAAVAVADLDGEGRGEVALGVPFAGASDRSRSGALYLLFGGDLEGAIDLSAESESRWLVRGAAENDNLGTGVAIADMNADGRGELVVAAAGIGGPEAPVGEIYVISLP